LIRTVIIAPALAARAGLRAILSAGGEFDITAEASRVPDLGPLTAEADVFLIQLDPGERLVLPEEWLGGEVPPAVLALTDTPEQAEALLDAPLRAWGLLPTDCTEEELITALYAVEMGMVVAPAEVIAGMLQPSPSPNNGEAFIELTARELEVLNLLAGGYANKQISRELGISEHTVKFHVSSIYTKLDVSNRAEAVRIGIQLGLIVI